MNTNTQLENFGHVKELIDQQSFSLAKSLLNDIIEQQPQSSDAYFLLSQIAIKEEKFDAALDYLKKAQHIQPFNKNYVLTLGELYTNLGQFIEAAKLYQGYLGMDKSQAEIYFQFGLVLTKLSQWQGAFEAFQSALKIDPSKLVYYMSFGLLMYQLNRHQDALKIYLSALSKGLKSEGLYQNIAKLMTDFGQVSEAKKILEQAVQAYPDNLSFIYRLCAFDESCLTLSLKEQLQNIVDSGDSPETLFYAHWLLSKFAQHSGDCIAEIELLEKAHNHFLNFAHFSLEKNVYLDLLKKFRLTDSLSKSLSSDDIISDSSPIFIVGVPRCGSTLIENIIHAGCPNVSKGEEIGAFFHSIASYLKKGQFVIDGLELNTVKETVTKIYQGLKLTNAGKRFTDKSLENIFLVDLILALYPNAKIIYCERNPLASIVSILKNNLVTLAWAHSIEDIYSYVDQCLNAIDRVRKKYPEKILTVSYENLVRSPEDESKKIMDFCDLAWTPECLNFHKNNVHSETASHLQIRDAINQKAINNHLAYQEILKKYTKQYHW